MTHGPMIGVVLAAALAAPQYARLPAQEISSSIAALLEAHDVSTVHSPADLERARLAKLYELSAFRPIWVDAAGRPTTRAREAIAILDDAAGDGLDPARYNSGLAAPTAPVAVEQAARYELALSAAMLRYLNDVRYGEIDPRTLGVDFPAPSGDDQVMTCLRDAVARARVADAVHCARPAIEEYELLRTELTRYRTLAATVEAWSPPAAALHPGDRFGDGPRLRARLIALGDLPSTAASRVLDTGIYDDTLVTGVKRFQRRHGLAVDGVIGRETGHELSVPLAHRARQIELALERLRWLPPPNDAPLLVLNIPTFELRGWDHGWAGDPAFTMKAIVGRPATPTPAFSKNIESVIFRPYWNVPLSILRHELLPALRKDPALLDRDQMEIVRGHGDDADVVDANRDSLDRLARGALRLRQRPGPKNALGLIKFMLPNEESVYLHGTPEQTLFVRSRRAFSHGCVRVEDPVALAEWVFTGSAEWSRERILETISTPAVVSRNVRLQRPIPVIFVYMTAVATPDGSVRFAPDIYGQDAALDRALRQRR